MLLWRISNHRTLDGRGGLVGSARWHTRGRAVVYLAESAPGALLESLVHLELALDDMPPAYQLMKVEAQANISIGTADVSHFSASWADDVSLTRATGDAWLGGRKSALLRVPSSIVPETFNIVLNPTHPDAAKMRIVWHRAHPWDKRLLK